MRHPNDGYLAVVLMRAHAAVESMQLGGLAGLTALTMGLGQERARRENEGEHIIANGAVKIAAISRDAVLAVPE